MNTRSVLLLPLLLALSAGLAQAGKSTGGTTTSPTSSPIPTMQDWMHTDVGSAWSQGYQGQGITVKVVDDFSSGTRYSGNLGDGSASRRHGEWTLKEASMVAPSASFQTHDLGNTSSVSLGRGLNVLNASYGSYGPAGLNTSTLTFTPRDSSLISYAKNGSAVVAKAAGNDGVAIGSAGAAGVDYLNVALRGTASTIYVGALSSNGSTAAPASLASYSNTAGTDTVVQNQFVVVGVEGGKTGLNGTSFAAPVVSGYAAIVGSKFTRATATQISNQLLNTARQDTITNYNAALHGKGEASLSRALAPIAIK